MDYNGTSLEEREEYALMLGMRFKSEEEGYRFYNNYAKDKGFSVRKDYVRRDPSTNSIIYRQYRCSREGYRKDKYMDITNKKREPRALSRCGCAAEFVITIDREVGDWYVKKFVAEHNHPLAKPDLVPYLWSQRGLSEAQKAEVIELKESGMRKHQIMEFMERHHGGYEEVGFVSRDLYNFFNRYTKKQILGGDAEHVIQYMQTRQQEDMEFFFEYEKDDAGHLRRLFFADAQSRIDYDAFGEVVVFDSTYRVNRYNLPFIPFVGVNHHRSTVIFACGIVSDETVETYEWLLKTFLTVMCQRHPKSLITDGDNAMRRAIQTVMPDSDHRLCTWHIEQNMLRHLNPNMLPEFRDFVHAPFGVDEFERKWTEFKENHHVSEDNIWIERMYHLRIKWAAAYTQGRVFLGMKSNQRSESLNSNLHKHLDRKMSLVDMVEHYEHCVSRMRHKEAELDAKTTQSVPFTAIDACQLEKDAACVFTHDVFRKVKSEIYKAMDWEIIDTINEEGSVKYVLSLRQNCEKMELVKCVFDEDSLKIVRCPCKKLECESIPCQHIFKVLQFLNLDKIPQSCVLRRWTMKAKCAFPSDRYGEIYSWSEQMECYRQLRSMGIEAFFKASMSKETAVKVKLFLQEILDGDEGESSEMDAALYGRVLPQSRQSDKISAVDILDPFNIKPKGAPSKRMRSFLEKRKKAIRQRVDIV